MWDGVSFKEMSSYSTPYTRLKQSYNNLTFFVYLFSGRPHYSTSKMHAPLEVAKGYHVGYIKQEPLSSAILT